MRDKMFVREMKKYMLDRANLWMWLALILVLTVVYYIGAYTPYMGDAYHPKEYNKLIKSICEDGMTPDSLEGEESYLLAGVDVSQEYMEIAEYRQYIEQLCSKRGSVLQKQTLQEQKLDQCYQQHYIKLKQISVEFRGNRAIWWFCKQDIGDVIIFIAILLFAFRLISQDRDTNMDCILLCTQNGTYIRLRNKWLFGMALSALFTLVVGALKLLLYTKAYEFKDWQGYLQSVPGFIASDLNLRIGSFVGLFLMAKIIGMMMIFSIVFLLNYRFVSSKIALLVDMAICGISAGLYMGIDLNSSWSLLRRINIVGVLDIGSLCEKYDPIAIGSSVYMSWRMLVAVVYLVCGLLSIWIILQSNWVRIMSEQNYEQRSVTNHAIASLSFPKKSLFHFEWSKLMGLERCAGMFIFLFVLISITYHKPVNLLVNADNKYYKVLIDEYKGKMTEQKAKKVQHQLNELNDLKQDIQENASLYTQDAYRMANDKIQKIPALKRFIAYQKYVQKRKDRETVYEKGYEMLFGKKVTGSYLLWCNFLAVFFMALICESLWNMERRAGMEKLSMPTQVSLKGVCRSKIIVMILVSVMVGCLVYVPWIVYVAQSYHLQEWNAPMDSMRMFCHISGCTLGVGVAIYYIGHIMYLNIVGLLMRFLCNKNIYSVMAVILTVILTMLPNIWIR